MTTRVALVGPIPPWRSGIADQDARLLAAMRRLGVEPFVIGFSRMYPRFLYPGTSDFSEEKIDFLEGKEVDAPLRASKARLRGASLLDGLNPYSFVRAARLLSFEEISLVILPWWTSYFAPHVCLFLSTLGAERPSAVRLLLCHNVFDHERNSLKDALTRAVLRRADRFVVQSARNARRDPRRAPRRARRRDPASLGAARGDPGPRGRARPDSECRSRRPVFLFSGILRPYKGWDVLLEAFPAVRREFPEALLVLAGEPWGEARDVSRPGRRRAYGWSCATSPRTSAPSGSPRATRSSAPIATPRAPGSPPTLSRSRAP